MRSALQAATARPKNPAKAQMHLKVAQQYITNPLLINGRKFHLRLWLLVTSHCPLRAYLHSNGLVLFSSEPYNPRKPVFAGVKPSASHVTNYARNEDTWVWGLNQLQQQLGEGVWGKLWHEITDKVALSISSALSSLHAAHKWLKPSISNYGFQMLGLDVLIDDDLHPWILEFNSAPSIMAVHSDPNVQQLIQQQKQGMLADMLAMVQHRFLPHAHEAAGQQPQDNHMGVNSRVERQHARGTGKFSWQQELGYELSNRGGFAPLMMSFPLHNNRIPWTSSDQQLQEVMKEPRHD